MNINKKFRTRLFSDLRIKGMAIELLFNDEIIATITYEKGIENMEIEVDPSITSINKGVFILNEFQAALEDARKLAIKCYNEDEENP